MPNEKRERKPQGKCVFCGGTGLSKEHIWSNWLSAYIPTKDQHGLYWSGAHYEKAGGKDSREAFWLEPPQSKAANGPVQQKKVRKVCVSCNTGWMSRVVDRAKPVVEKMMLDTPYRLSHDDMTNLAAWIAITTIMQEYGNPRQKRAISDEDRQFLMNEGRPPILWTIWVGRYVGEYWNPLGHQHMPVEYSEGSLGGEPQSALDPPRYQLQMTTFAVRSLFAHVFTGTHRNMIAHYRWYISGSGFNLRRLWPLNPDHIDCPASTAIDDRERIRIISKWLREKWGVRVVDDSLLAFIKPPKPLP